MFKAASKDSPPAAVPSNVTPTSLSSKAGKLRVTPEGGLRFVGDGGGGSGAQGKGSTPTNPQGEKQKFFATRSADGKWNLLMAPTSDPSRLFLVQPAPGHKFQVSDGGVRVENVSGAASHGSTSSGEASCTSSNGCVEEHGSVIAGQESGGGEATPGTPKSIAVPVAQLRSSTSPHTITATTTSPTGSVTTTSASGDNVRVSTPREQKKSFFKSRTSKEREALKASVQHVVGKKVLSIPKRGTKSGAATDSPSKKGKKGSKSGKSSKSHSKSSTLPSSLQDSMSQSFSLMSVSPGSISNKTPSPAAFPATVTMSPAGCTDVVTTVSSSVTSSVPVTSTSAISISTSHQLTSSPSSSAQGLLMTSSLSPSLTSHGHQSENISPPGSPVSDVPAASPKPVSPLSSQLSFTSPPSPEQTSQPTASCSRSRNSSVDRDDCDGMTSSVSDIRSSSAKPLTVQIPQSDGDEDSGAENMGATASPSAAEKQPLKSGDESAEMPDKLSTEKPVKKSTKTKCKSSKAARRSLRGRPDNVSTGHQEHSLPHQDAHVPTQSMEADEAATPSITDPPRIGDAGDDNVDSVADFAAQIPKNDDPLYSRQAQGTDCAKETEHVDADDSATEVSEMEERYPRRNSRRSSAVYETHTLDKSESKRPEKEAKTKKTSKVDSPVKVPKGRASKKRSKTAEAPPDTGSDTDDYEPLIFKAKRTRRSSSKSENQGENTIDNIESEKSHDVVSCEQKTPDRTENPVSDSEAATENQSKPETEKDPRTENSAGVDSDSGELPRDQDISISQDQSKIAGPSDSSNKQSTPCVKERDSRATRASRRSQEDSCTLQTESQAENTNTVQQLEDSTTEASVSAKQSTKKRKKRKSELEKLMEAQAALAEKVPMEEDKELVPMEEVAEEKLDESPQPDQENCSVTGEEETDLVPEDNENNPEPKEEEINLAPTDSSPAEKKKDPTQAEKDSTPVEEERDSAALEEENDSAPTEADADLIPGDLIQTETEKDSATIDEARNSPSEEMLKNTPTQETGESAFLELHKEDTSHEDLAAEEPKTSQEPQSSEHVETFSEATEHESFHHEERKQKKKKKKKKKLKILINLTEAKSKEVPDKDDEQSDVVSSPVPDPTQDTHEETPGDVDQPSGEVTENLSTQESTMDTETHEESTPSLTVSTHGGKSKKKKRKKNKKLKIIFGSEHETSTREIPDSAVSDSNSRNAGDSLPELHQTDSLDSSHTFTDNEASNSNTAFDAAVAKPAKKPRRKRLTELEKIIRDQEAIARAEQMAIENQEPVPKTSEKGAEKETDKEESKTAEKASDKDGTMIAEKVPDTDQTKRAERDTDKEETQRPEPETNRGESTTTNEDNQGEELEPIEPEPQEEQESTNTAEVSASPQAETSREDTVPAHSEEAVQRKDQEAEKGEKLKKKRKRKKKEPTVGVIRMPPLASGTDTDATEPMTDVDDVIHPITIVSIPDVPLPTDLPSVSGDVEQVSGMETDEDEDPQAKANRAMGRYLNSRPFTRSELTGMFGMPYVVLEKLSEVDIYFMSRRFRNARVSSRAKCSLHCRQRTLQYLCELNMIDCTPLRGMKRPAGIAVPAESNQASSEEPPPKKKRGRKRKEHVEGEEKVKKKKRKEVKEGEADKDKAASDESLVEIDIPASQGARPTTSFPKEVILVSPGDKGFPVYGTARPYLPPAANTNLPRFPSSTVGRVVRLSVPVNPPRPSYTLVRPGAMTTAAGGPRFISLPSLATSGASSLPQVITLPALSAASSGVPRTIPPLLASASASTTSPSLKDAMRATLTQAISSSLTKANPTASTSASPTATTNQALNSALISALSGSVSKGAVLVQAAPGSVNTVAGTQGAVALNKQFFVVQMGDKRVLVPASALGTATTTATGTTTTAATTSASTTAAALQSLFNSGMLRATAPSTIPTVVPESVAPPRPTPGSMARIVLSSRRPPAPTLSPRTGPTASSLLFANRPRLTQPNQVWAGPRTVLEGNRRVLVSPANQPQGIRVVISGASTLNTGSRFSVASSRGGGVFVTSHPAGTSLVRMPAAPAKPGKRVMTEEERLRKRARLEKKYPLPPGVVIKTEPETFGYGGEGKTTQAGTTRVLLSTMGRGLASLGQPIPVLSAARGGPIIIRQAAPGSTASPRSGSLLGPLIIRVPSPATAGAPRIAAPRIAAIPSSVATSLLSSTARLAATATTSSSPTVVSLLSVPPTSVTSTTTTSRAATASTSVSSSALSTSSSATGTVTSAAAPRPSVTVAAATTVPRPPLTVAAFDDDDDDAVYIVDSPPPPTTQASSSQKEKSQDAVSTPVISAPSASAYSTTTTTAAAVVVSSAGPQTASTSPSPFVAVTTASDTSLSTVTSTDVTATLVATSTTSSALTTNAATASPVTHLTSSISAVSSVDEDINQDDVSDSQDDVTVSLPSDNTTASSTSVTTTTTFSSTTNSMSSTTTTATTTTHTPNTSVVEALLRGSPSPSFSSPSSPMPSTSTSTALHPSRLVSLGAMFARQAAESGSLTSVDTRSLQSERMQRLKEALSKQMGNVSDERRQRALQALAQQFGRGGGEGGVGARSGETLTESPNTPSPASRESSAPRSVPSAGQSENNAVVIIDDNDAVDTDTGTDTRDGTETDANNDTDTQDGTDADTRDNADTRDGTDTRDGAGTDANNDTETDTRDGIEEDSETHTANKRHADDKMDEDNRRGEDDNRDEEDTAIIVERNEVESATSRSDSDRVNPTIECDSETINQRTEDNNTERIGDSDITGVDKSTESVSARTEQSADNETNNTSHSVNSETVDRTSHSAENETDGADANIDDNMASVNQSADKETVDRTSHSPEDGTSVGNITASVNGSDETDSVPVNKSIVDDIVAVEPSTENDTLRPGNSDVNSPADQDTTAVEQTKDDVSNDDEEMAEVSTPINVERDSAEKTPVTLGVEEKPATEKDDTSTTQETDAREDTLMDTDEAESTALTSEQTAKSMAETSPAEKETPNSASVGDEFSDVTSAKDDVMDATAACDVNAEKDPSGEGQGDKTPSESGPGTTTGEKV